MRSNFFYVIESLRHHPPPLFSLSWKESYLRATNCKDVAVHVRYMIMAPSRNKKLGRKRWSRLPTSNEMDQSILIDEVSHILRFEVQPRNKSTLLLLQLLTIEGIVQGSKQSRMKNKWSWFSWSFGNRTYRIGVLLLLVDSLIRPVVTCKSTRRITYVPKSDFMGPKSIRCFPWLDY